MARDYYSEFNQKHGYKEENVYTNQPRDPSRTQVGQQKESPHYWYDNPFNFVYIGMSVLTVLLVVIIVLLVAFRTKKKPA